VLDSWFDNYRGVIALIRVVDGRLQSDKSKIRRMSTGLDYQVERVGAFTPKAVDVPQLPTGAVGFMVAGLKNVAAARVGDTVTLSRRPAARPTALAAPFPPTYAMLVRTGRPLQEDIMTSGQRNFSTGKIHGKIHLHRQFQCVHRRAARCRGFGRLCAGHG